MAKSKFGFITIILGILLIVASLLIYFFVTNTFLTGVYSEVFSIGITLLLVGLIFIIWRIKIG